MTVTIYHNPKCGTSRNTLELIRAAGIEPTVIEYLKTPPTRAKLKELSASMGVTPRGLLRTKEPISRLRGRVHPYPDAPGAIVIPTFHPAFILRNPGLEYRKQAFEDLKLIRREYDRVRGVGSG